MEKRVLRNLLDSKKVAILRALYFAKEDMYLRELAKESKVPVTTVLRILRELVTLGLVRVKETKLAKFYGLVKDGKTIFLDGWFKEESLLDVFVRLAKSVEGVKEIILQGKVEDGKANVVVIGNNVDDQKIEQICEKIKDQGFDLSHLILNEKQFNKLDGMGVLGGEKKIL